jgi:hypothetical protein
MFRGSASTNLNGSHSDGFLSHLIREKAKNDGCHGIGTLDTASLKLVSDNAVTPSNSLRKRFSASPENILPIALNQNSIKAQCPIDGPFQTARKTHNRTAASPASSPFAQTPSIQKQSYESRWLTMTGNGGACSETLPTVPTRSSGRRRNYRAFPEFMKTLPYDYDYDNSFVSSSTSSGSTALDVVSSICSSVGTDSVTINTYTIQNSHLSSASTSTNERSLGSSAPKKTAVVAAPASIPKPRSPQKTRNPSSSNCSRTQCTSNVEPTTPTVSNTDSRRRLLAATAGLSKSSYRGMSGSGRKNRTLDLHRQSDLLHSAGITF